MSNYAGLTTEQAIRERDYALQRSREHKERYIDNVFLFTETMDASEYEQRLKTIPKNYEVSVSPFMWHMLYPDLTKEWFMETLKIDRIGVISGTTYKCGTKVVLCSMVPFDLYTHRGEMWVIDPDQCSLEEK